MKIIITTCIIYLLINCSSTCYGNTLTPTLKLDFENGFIADTIKGNIVAKQLLFPKIVDGKFGKAALVGPLQGQLSFPTNEILNPTTGTVSMWISPVDWEPSDQKFHVFFEAKGEGNLILYKYLTDNKLLFLTTETKSGGPYYSVGKKVAWKKNEWIFLSATWSLDGISIYVNGEPVNSTKIRAALPIKLGDYFSIGDSPWSTPRISETKIDEVSIFQEELTAPEIYSLYKQYNQDGTKTLIAQADIKEVTLKSINPTTLPSKDIICEIKLNRMFSEEPIPDAALTIKHNGITVGEVNNIKLNKETTEIPIQRFINEDGIYIVEIKIYIKNELYNVLTKEYQKLNLEHLSRNIDKAIPTNSAWQEIIANEKTVNVAGKIISFESDSIINSISHKDQKLITRPITINSNNDNLLSTSENRAIIINNAINNANVTNYSNNGICNIESQIDFDGFIWNKVECTSNETLKNINIKIHFDNKMSKYIHKWSKTRQMNTSELSSTNGIVYESEFIPYIWIGDEEKGVSLLFESSNNWDYALNKNAITLERTNKELIAKLQISNEKPGNKRFEFEFGIIATPSKTTNPNQYLEIHPLTAANYNIIWPNNEVDSFKYYGLPVPKNSLSLKEKVNKLHKNNYLAIPYVCPTFVSTATPEWKYFETEWSLNKYDSTSTDVLLYKAPLGMVNPQSISWRNTLLNEIENYHDLIGLDGIYLDNIFLYDIYQPSSGYGYDRLINDKDVKTPDYPIRAYRELLKDIYTLVKRLNPNAPVITHISGQINPAFISFADAYVNGEQYRNAIGENYDKLIPQWEYRVDYSNVIWGAKPIFLPQFNNNAIKDIKPTRQLLKSLLLNNISIWPKWSNIDEINSTITPILKLKQTPYIFHAYYTSTSKALTKKNSNIDISEYHGDKIIAILGNSTDFTQTDTVCTSNEYLQYSILDNKKQTTCLNLEIPSHDFVLLELNQKIK